MGSQSRKLFSSDASSSSTEAARDSPSRGPLADVPISNNPDSISWRFLEFHRQNPQVYAELVRLVRVALGRGRKKIGIKMLWEVVRWNLWLRTDAESDGFKMNNNYHSRYARLIMKNEPDLAGVFEVRELKSC
jgi:hypothetical protein